MTSNESRKLAREILHESRVEGECLEIEARSAVPAAPVKSEPDRLTMSAEMIARAAADPACDPQKMRELLELYRECQADIARREFHSALAAVQTRVPRVVKRGSITVRGERQSSYARYEDVDRVLRPILAEHGISVSYDTETMSGAMKITIIVTHVAGHVERRSITLPIDESGSKNRTQGHGSTVTYGKRYLLCAFFNVVTIGEDNDGMGEVIDADQVNRINDLLIATESDRAKFLAWLGVREVEYIPKGKFKAALDALRRKAEARK